MANEGLTEKFKAAPRIKALPLEDAIVLFDALADRPDIAFGYARDGCYARAHLMCKQMFEQGLTPQKAWAFEGRDYLHVDMPNGRRVQWGWHVAPTLAVQTADGGVEDMVFDPGLFDGPVTLQEWGETIHAEPHRVQIAPFGAPPKGCSGSYTPHSTITGRELETHAKDKMKQYIQFQGQGQRVLLPTQVRRHMCIMRPYAVSLQGRTWVSVAHQASAAPRPPPSLNR